MYFFYNVKDFVVTFDQLNAFLLNNATNAIYRALICIDKDGETTSGIYWRICLAKKYIRNVSKSLGKVDTLPKIHIKWKLEHVN